MTEKPLAMLEQRRIEARLVKNIYDVLVERHGEDEAKEVIGVAVKNAAVEQGAHFRAQHGAEHGGDPGLRDFAALGRLWEMGGALERKVHLESEERLEYDIVHCAYANMYREMGLGEIGHLLSCNRDGTFCTGYNPKMKLTRTQTIMEGADHCDFRYRMEADEDG